MDSSDLIGQNFDIYRCEYWLAPVFIRIEETQRSAQFNLFAELTLVVASIFAGGLGNLRNIYGFGF